jgi:hypothetical protein
MPDTKFTKYLETKRDAYDEGTRTFTPKEVMKLALDKAELMKDKGEWLEATPEGEKIIALMAKLKTLEKSNLSLENRLKKSKGVRTRTRDPASAAIKAAKAAGTSRKPTRVTVTARCRLGRPRKPRMSLARMRRQRRQPLIIGARSMAITRFTSPWSASSRPTASPLLRQTPRSSRAPSAQPWKLSKPS